MRKKHRKIEETVLSAQNISGTPENPFDLVNAFGTYNVQNTANTENLFPQIAQGLAPSEDEPPTE